jgi:serine/threonine protein kinase
MSSPSDESRLADLLAAYDEARAAGVPPPDQPTAQPPGTLPVDPDLLTGWRDGRECIDLLHELYPAQRSGPADDWPGTGGKFGRFELRAEVGRGGMGVVFRALDPRLGREVALKVPRPEFRQSRAHRRRFLREARAAAVLHHPNVVPVYEADRVEAVPYIVAEYIDGPSLAGWLLAHPGPVPVEVAVGWVAQVADGVQHAHSRGVIHRDLKPANVLLRMGNEEGVTSSPIPHSPFPIPMVTDFGLAKVNDPGLSSSQTQGRVGTPRYMAPEQAFSDFGPVGPATDVHGLGLILFELLTGRPAYDGATHEEIFRRLLAPDVPTVRRLCPGAPVWLDVVCRRCLEKEPGRRHASAADLAEGLRGFSDRDPIRAESEGWLSRLARRFLRR